MSNPVEPHSIRIFLTGFVMGMADLVPGISGGTVALLGGIYARLLGAISAVNVTSVKMLLTGRWLAAMAAGGWSFLADSAVRYSQCYFWCRKNTPLSVRSPSYYYVELVFGVGIYSWHYAPKNLVQGAVSGYWLCFVRFFNQWFIGSVTHA